VSSVPIPDADQGRQLLALYDRALPQVYGYLRARVPSDAVAEDLTAETFLAAVQAVKAAKVPKLTIAWLVTVARNKLVDHWRREAREESNLALASDESVDDDLDQHFERMRARDVLSELGAHHCAALTLRYLDGLSVPEVADQLGRTVHATEALLVRARNAFRARYAERGCDDD
jgi:RNA polymerase sigma-70 factor (ECF subfamily)